MKTAMMPRSNFVVDPLFDFIHCEYMNVGLICPEYMTMCFARGSAWFFFF